MPYTDASSQTIISGLSKHPSVNLAPLILTNAATPPEDMPTKPPNPPPTPPPIDKSSGRPRLQARLTLPPYPDPDSQDPRSPPPTEALLSPLPEANRLHAGHTPMLPLASLSPLPTAANGELTPDPDEVVEAMSLPVEMMEQGEISPEEVILSGPLTLPSVPGDGPADLEDRIELRALDKVLEKVARERSRSASPGDEEGGDAMDMEMEMDLEEVGARLTRKRSSQSGSGRRSSENIEVVDGIRLKKPKMNLGAPLGQV